MRGNLNFPVGLRAGKEPYSVLNMWLGGLQIRSAASAEIRTPNRPVRNLVAVPTTLCCHVVFF